MMRIERLWIPAVLLAVVLPMAAQGQEAHDYIGTKKCKTCHIKEWRSWSETKMANAFELLKPGVNAEAKTGAGLDPNQDYTTDQECLRCHVTGLGKPGGFVDIETTPELAGVGCESCHGAGGSYTKEGFMTLKNKEYKKAEVVAQGLVPQVSAAQCTGCHNSESPFVGDDFVFDFEANKGEGTHELFPLKYEHE